MELCHLIVEILKHYQMAPLPFCRRLVFCFYLYPVQCHSILEENAPSQRNMRAHINLVTLTFLLYLQDAAINIGLRFDPQNGPWPCTCPQGCVYNNGSNAEHILITKEDILAGLGKIITYYQTSQICCSVATLNTTTPTLQH